MTSDDHRWGLQSGGAATLAVSVFPQPYTGSSAAHLTFAAVGFVALTLWPALWPPPRRVARIALACVLAALLVWLGVELDGGKQLGLSERLLAGAQALCPLVLVLTVWRRHDDNTSPRCVQVA